MTITDQIEQRADWLFVNGANTFNILDLGLVIVENDRNPCQLVCLLATKFTHPVGAGPGTTSDVVDVDRVHGMLAW